MNTHKQEQKSGNKSHSSIMLIGGKSLAKIEEKVERLIKKDVQEKGYEIYDIEYVKEGSEYYLRIFIENPEKNISIEDCEIVNNIVNEILDKEDIIKTQYYLEISSTGVEKKLRKHEHFEKAIGKTIKIKLFKKNQEGKKEYEGILKKADLEEITIEENGKTVNVSIKEIAHANTVYNW